MFDLLLHGGDVIDVESRSLLRGHDVAVVDGRVARIGRLDSAQAVKTIDVRGKLVSPGLVDLHTHVFDGGGFYGLSAEAVAWRSGVTTWVDAGSAGAYTFGAFREITARQPVRVRALLNVSAIGLAGESFECRVIDNCAVDAAIACIEQNRDVIVGVKARIDHNTVGANGIEPLRRALLVADAVGLPLMVHIGNAPPTVREILALVRPGDIVTHCATGVAEGLIDDHGRVLPEVREAYDRGVLMDVGHGVGGFSFDVMESLLEVGCVPHTISSDLHATSVTRGALDLPTVLTKMLALGMTVVEVVERATAACATALPLGDELGRLREGGVADIAVLELQDQQTTVSDAYGQIRQAPARLVAHRTFVGGHELAAADEAVAAEAWPTVNDLARPGDYPRAQKGKNA